MIIHYAGGVSRPPAPTRDQILRAQITFQGLTVDGIPWFEPAIDQLDAAGRQRLYAVKRAAGDHVVIVALSHAYFEPGVPPIIQAGKDWTSDLPGLHALLDEIINNGFYVWLFLAGDGEGAGPGYNDPVGWTYGKQWLMQNFQRVYDALGDLSPFIVWVPGFDGVVPGWQPPHSVDPVLLHLRAVIGTTGYLGLELAAGYASWGDGGDNWKSPAGKTVDLILCELPTGLGQPKDQIWQIAARLVRPYHRPPDQPSGDDPNPPFYLSDGTPRGPFYASFFEYDAFRWVRGQVTAAQVSQEREYLRALSDNTLVG